MDRIQPKPISTVEPVVSRINETSMERKKKVGHDKYIQALVELLTMRLSFGIF